MVTRRRFRIMSGGLVLCLAMAGDGMAGMPDAGQVREAQALGTAPSSIAAEHEELHAALARVTRAGGRTAAEAKQVEKLLRPHFAKEERFALPPLAALPALAAGRIPSNAAEIVRMSDLLREDMPAMLAEHQAIGQALERLRMAARDERKPEAAAFAEHLKAHAKQEEEIPYPAAILAGRYLQLKQQ